MTNLQSNLAKAIIAEAENRYSDLSQVKLIWFPTVSMRSYETGMYDLNSDGNIMQMFHVLSEITKLVQKIAIVVPTNSNEAYWYLQKRAFGLDNIEFFCIDYGENIAETRQIFNNSCVLQEFAKNVYDNLSNTIIISDFECIFNLGVPVVYRFNVSPEIWSDRQKMLAWQHHVFVLNKNQLNHPLAEVQTKWFNKQAIYEIAMKVENEFVVNSPTLFVPFRLSDKDYHIDEIIKYAEVSGKTLLVTDPNDTSNKIKTCANIVVNPELRDKYKLFAFLKANSDNPNLIIPYLSDPTVVLHQSFLEMMVLCPHRMKFPWYIDTTEVIEYFNLLLKK